jgi:hypothetical protein
MPQKKNLTKLRKASARSSRKASPKAATGNGAHSTGESKSNRNGSKKLSADELMLRVWQKIYEAHHPIKKARGR